MSVINIDCKRKEYRKVNNVWKLYSTNTDIVDSYFISSMVEAGYYFTKLGGTQWVYYAQVNKFRNSVVKVVVDSICGSVKCVYIFSYNNAKLCDNIDYLF